MVIGSQILEQKWKNEETWLRLTIWIESDEHFYQTQEPDPYTYGYWICTVCFRLFRHKNLIHIVWKTSEKYDISFVEFGKGRWIK